MLKEEGFEVEEGMISDIADNRITLQLQGTNSSILKSPSKFQINTGAKYDIDNSKISANVEVSYTSQVNTKLECAHCSFGACMSQSKFK